MAGVKISDLDLVVQINDSDYIPLARGAETKKIEGKRFASKLALDGVDTRVTEVSAYVNERFNEVNDLISGIDVTKGYDAITTDIFVTNTTSQTHFQLYGLSDNLADFSINSAAYRVVVDGLCQEPEYSYDISGKTIVFSQPVPMGSRVVVSYMKALTGFDPVTNSFLGSGSQQNFNLVGFSMPLDDAKARVTIDGVLQEADDDYTIVPNLLSFVTPPPYEARISVVSEDVFYSSPVVKAKHTANGTTALFPVPPSIAIPFDDPSAYRIDVDGVVQEPGNGYVIVNRSTISFATAPAAGSKIVIITSSKPVGLIEENMGAEVFYSNTVLTSSVFVPPRKNAMSIGPITIPSGISVTVSPGSVYTVVI
jgi:hypothetical protein